MRFSSTLVLVSVSMFLPAALQAQKTITGQAAFADWNQQQPGLRRKITLADLPNPKPDEAVNNTPHVIARPTEAWPIAPAGFKVTLYAGGDSTPMQRADNKEVMTVSKGTFTMPRLIRTAPNDDLFLAGSGAGTRTSLRGVGPDGKAAQIEKFATGLDHPFGIAFYPADNPKYVYVGNATTVQRIPYHAGGLHATGPAETVIPDVPGYRQLARGGHWTRDGAFSQDRQHMFVSVGSGSNIDDPDTHPGEFHRADVLEYTPDGKFEEVYATGIRNCVGEAINPTAGQLWCSTNERDVLGDNLVPDYITHVEEDGFYGWPWFYMGDHQDPRHKGKHPELASKVLVPDVLLQPHFASLEMTFDEGKQFPASYHGWAFAAEHGSWNKSRRAGYEVIAVPVEDGKATG